MANYRTVITVDNKEYSTLRDILPDSGTLEILFIAKTPALLSVQVGHYFQGKQGKMFWNKLQEYGILHVPKGEHADEHLLFNNYGITDIVKIPRNYGNEPSDEEYIIGIKRIMGNINTFRPRVIIFVYKRVLDNILKHNFNLQTKSSYGFNPILEDYFHSKVFVFPMPGTPCNKEMADVFMEELRMFLEIKIDPISY